MAASRAPASTSGHDQPGAVAVLRAMAEERLTAESGVRACLARIEAIDRRGPRLKSVIELNPDALAIARELDRERSAGRGAARCTASRCSSRTTSRPATACSTSAGSLALAGARAPRDAFVVERLRAAGARDPRPRPTSRSGRTSARTRSTRGWSARGGQTRNPYALDRNTSGSSSGSAAAIAAEPLRRSRSAPRPTARSSRPSSICGLVGIKPTVGLVSRAGIVPIAHSQDTRRADDAQRRRRGAPAARDGRRRVARRRDAAAPATRAGDYVALARSDGLRARASASRATSSAASTRSTALIEEAIAVMKSAGAEIVDPVDARRRRQARRGRARASSCTSSRPDLDAVPRRARPPTRRCTRSPTSSPSTEERRARDAVLRPGAVRARRGARAARREGLPRGARRAAAGRARRRASIASSTAHRLDALVAPTGAPAWLDRPPSTAITTAPASRRRRRSRAIRTSRSRPASSAACRSGISFVGAAWSEARLLAFGHAFEKATAHRRAPRFARRTTPG